MDELDIPFEEELFHQKPFYTLRVCKDCRGDWLDAIERWFVEQEIKPEPNPERCIPVTDRGRVIWLTQEEFDERQGADTHLQEGE